MYRPRRLGALVAGVLVAVTLPGPAAAGPATRPAFGDLSAPIRPGIRTETAGGRCTANFVFTDDRGRVYLGQSGHCSRVPDENAPFDTTTCEFGRQAPLGTRVPLGETGISGRLVYSSWRTMPEVGERDPDTCRYNDFALIQVPASAIGAVNPTVPLFGGPTDLNTDGIRPGDLLTGWGASPLRQGVRLIEPKQTLGVRTHPSGRVHVVYSITPGVPGDSGGPYLDPAGRAVGSLSEITLDPPAGNAITDIARALAYAERHGGVRGLRLVPGTGAFAGPVLLRALLASPDPPP
ncbi:hypothetical protein GCM10009547_03410 [Sporichthya brevicatena]|uniref:Serine protease n=1 Tax=Sporichthya brevicatena TaxID=171442 RepID=A0ABN1G6F0_9ACTN